MKKFLALLLIPLCLLFCACGTASADQPKTGKLYTVTEAYEKGYLTREDVMSIAYYHNGGREINEAVMDEDYAPMPKSPEQLSDETQETVKQTYFKHINAKSEVEIKSINYYGTYNDCIAVYITALIGYTAALWTETVAGVDIEYNCGNRIYVWADKEEVKSSGSFYSVPEAYEKGYLTREDLTNIAAVYNGEVQCDQKLDSQTELLIKECEAEKLRNERDIVEAEAKGIEIVKFYGKYSNCYVVSTESIYEFSNTDVPNEWFYIDGIGFHKTDHYGIWTFVINV